MADIVIFGAGDIGQLAHFYLTKDSPHKPVAFTMDSAYIKEPSFLDLPVVPFEEVQRLFPPQQFKMFIAVSYSAVNKVRAAKYAEAKEKGYELISYISSKASYFGTPVGDNCFIFEDNTIQPFTRIGNNVTLWSGNHIGHHSTIGDHCFISSHVVISGGVVVEPYCFLGVNSTVRDHVTIGSRCVVGMGSMITKNLEPGGVYVGSPAKRQASSEEIKKI
ncbi:MAG TPA: acetyltransferase [Polyangia bacterium]|nr:acetyltransferase [Polyangia bacterium]